MEFINLSNSFSKSFSNKIYTFNKILKYAYFAGNYLNVFPKFCQICSEKKYCKKNFIINLECQLIEINLSFNNIKKVSYSS